MNDPHVEWLEYRVETGPDLSYANPSPVIGETPAFKYRLEQSGSGHRLKLEMKTHFATESEACDAARPFLEDWEVSAALNGNLEQLKFRFSGAHVIDRAPTAGHHHASLGGGVGLVMHATAECAIVLNNYPTPPQQFRYSTDVAVMWKRYEIYRKGVESILSVAYFCFSYICLAGGGKRAVAATKYNIDEEVLKELSTLAATGGDWSEARKAEHDSTATPLTSLQKHWLETALKLLIERVAANAADPSATFAPITLSDLPTL